MKYYILYIVLLLTLLMGCSSEEYYLEKKSLSQGKIVFTINTPIMQTRANNDFFIATLDLLMCDETERILQKVRATGSGSTYSADILYSEEIRSVHFIANYNWSTWSDEFIGKDVREVLMGIATTDFVAWQRVEVNGITTSSPFNNSIELILNKAKFELSIETNRLTDISFAICNYDRGTIAPFNVQNHTFQEGYVSVPASAQIKKPNESDFVSVDQYCFTFERNNSKVKDATYSCLIIKGKYDGVFYYYKIDLIGSDKKRHDIQRNYSYKIRITNVSDKGYSTLQEAIDGVAANTNFSFDENLEIYPSITDGRRKLEVEKNFILITRNNQSANFKASYLTYHNSVGWKTVFGKFQNAEIEDVENFGVAVKGVNIDSGGNVFVELANITSEEKRSKIKITVKDENEGVELFRKVTVVVRQPYQFQINPVSGYGGGQGSKRRFSLSLPTNFPKELLPLAVQFITADYFPDESSNMIYKGVDESSKSPIYEYIIPTDYIPGRSMELILKLNKNSSEEKIQVRALYFDNQEFMLN